ncbi:MAG: hypothetical protein PHV17_00345 [Candidatus Omnitrophica bacterium]|nr:hypothetical protein [Candidatus Omnitrophota bacterium]
MKKGLTLIEVFVVGLLASLLAGMLVLALLQMNQILSQKNIQSGLQADIQTALDAMTKDLRQADFANISITVDSPLTNTDSLRYFLPQDTTPLDGVADLDGNMNIIWDSTSRLFTYNLANGTLERQYGSEVDVLASNLTRIQFFDRNRDASLHSKEIKVIIEASKIALNQRSYAVNSTTIIGVRN